MDPATLLTLTSAAQGGQGSVPSALPQSVDFSSSASASNETKNTFKTGEFNFKSSGSSPLLIAAGMVLLFLLFKK